MAIDVEITAFLGVLAKYQLLTPAQLEAAQHWGAAEPKKLAAELIQRGWLTPLQANRVLQGRGDSLVLGPYVLLEQIGQGGMGRVFKARHTVMDRIVALKVIRGDRLDEPEHLSRFRREMQAAAKLAHANVVLAHDAALAGESYYLAMEYVEGIDLARLVKERGKLPPAQACDYIRQAALGLQHASERGLVHRDVKPSNLILATQSNTIKLLDLGIARLRTHLDLEATASALTNEGAVVGTPDYIAPEQALDSRSADIRADIYSLGCTLYHLLAGQPPFPGGSLTEKLLRHQQAEPQAIERLCPESAAVAPIIRKMMAKQPQDRYQSPQDVADALAPFAAAVQIPVTAHAVSALPETITATGSDEPTQPAPTPRQVESLQRSHRGLVLLAVAAVLFVALTALGGGAVLLLLLLAPAGPSKSHGVDGSHFVGAPDVKIREAPAGAAKKDEPIAGVVPPKQGKPAPGAPAKKEPQQPPPTQPEPKQPESKQPEPKQPELKDTPPIRVEKLATMPADGPARLIADLKGHTGTVQCLVFAPDGTRLASGGDDRQARLWDGRTGAAQGAPLRHSEPVRALAFSGDGKQLATGSYGGGYDAAIKIWDLAGKRDAQTLPWKDQTGTPSMAQVNSVAFSPDGKRLAAGGGPLRVWDLAKGGQPVVFGWQKTFPSYMYGVTFAPDGKSVAAGCHERGDNIRIWAIDDHGEPTFLQGKPMAFGLSHSDIRGVLAYVASGTRLVRVTSDGTAVGFGKATATVMLWDVDPKDQRITLRDTIKIPGGGVFALASAADGRLRAAAAVGNPGPGAGFMPEAAPAEVQIWDEATGMVRTIATGHKQHVTALAFSPDGARLATGSADQSAKLWDLTR